MQALHLAHLNRPNQRPVLPSENFASHLPFSLLDLFREWREVPLKVSAKIANFVALKDYPRSIVSPFGFYQHANTVPQEDSKLFLWLFINEFILAILAKISSDHEFES